MPYTRIKLIRRQHPITYLLRKTWLLPARISFSETHGFTKLVSSLCIALKDDAKAQCSNTVFLSCLFSSTYSLYSSYRCICPKGQINSHNNIQLLKDKKIIQFSYSQRNATPLCDLLGSERGVWGESKWRALEPACPRPPTTFHQNLKKLQNSCYLFNT